MTRARKTFSVPKLQNTIAFIVSLCMHLTAAIVLAFCLVMGGGERSGALLVSMDSATSSAPELEAFEIENSSPVESNPELAETESPAMEAVLPIADVNPVIDQQVSPIGLSQSLVSSQVRFATASSGAVGNGSSASTEFDKSKTSATFFGAEAYGNRFVFVIDSSSSMRGPRWDALYRELMRAIQALSEDQEFFIISFDSLAHPMFDIPPPKGTFLSPTAENFERVSSWIRGISLGHSTLPSGAVGIAMSLKPDAVFLLSDGEIADNTLQDLRRWNRVRDEEGAVKARFPIHTVSLLSPIGFATLEAIANENEGTFTPVAFQFR